MIVTFADTDLEELIMTGVNHRYRRLSQDKKFMRSLARVYRDLLAVPHVSVLRQFSYLHYEQLRHVALSAVRVQNGRVERLLFRESDEGICITIIELNMTHYGNKK